MTSCRVFLSRYMIKTSIGLNMVTLWKRNACYKLSAGYHIDQSINALQNWQKIAPPCGWMKRYHSKCADTNAVQPVSHNFPRKMVYGLHSSSKMCFALLNSTDFNTFFCSSGISFLGSHLVVVITGIQYIGTSTSGEPVASCLKYQCD